MRSYLLARLARDGRHDLIKQVEAKQLSARAAGIAAGFIKPPSDIAWTLNVQVPPGA